MPAALAAFWSARWTFTRGITEPLPHQISRYLDQLPAAVLRFRKREVNQVPVKLYFAPVEPPNIPGLDIT
jgi:hypothetical protein